MFKIPTLLPYPKIEHIDNCAEIRGIFCYVVKDYEPGIAAIIKLHEGDIGIVVGDWAGNRASPKNKILWEQSEGFLRHSAYSFVQIMRHIRIDQAEFFISSDGLLVDAQVSLNRFIGPGMLRDLFSTVSKTQDVEELTVLDDSKLKKLTSSNNKYILKPSRYRHYVRDNNIYPLYARI